MPPASRSMRASRTMMTVRSGGLMPRNVTQSSARLSWRGAGAGAGPVFWFSISLLLDDDRVVRGASPISALAEESMQFDERVHRYPAEPISMPAHATGSSIHAATTVTTPGSASICTNRPERGWAEWRRGRSSTRACALRSPRPFRSPQACQRHEFRRSPFRRCLSCGQQHGFEVDLTVKQPASVQDGEIAFVTELNVAA